MADPIPGRFLCAYPAANLYLDAYRVHVEEILGMGFDTIVLCIPEHYVAYHLPVVREMIAATHAAGLGCWADPWGVAGLFDGEAFHRPTDVPDTIVRCWIEAVGNVDPECRPDAIFLDNPCPAIPSLIATWGAQARALDLGCQVCLSADRHRDNPDLFDRVADLDVVDGIHTDPYCLGRIEEFRVDTSVQPWAGRLARAARQFGKRATIWVQGFRLPAGSEDLPIQAAQVALDQGIDGIGFWSFRASEPWSGRPADHRKVWTRFGAWLRDRRDVDHENPVLG